MSQSLLHSGKWTPAIYQPRLSTGFLRPGYQSKPPDVHDGWRMGDQRTRMDPAPSSAQQKYMTGQSNLNKPTQTAGMSLDRPGLVGTRVSRPRGSGGGILVPSANFFPGCFRRSKLKVLPRYGWVRTSLLALNPYKDYFPTYPF